VFPRGSRAGIPGALSGFISITFPLAIGHPTAMDCRLLQKKNSPFLDEAAAWIASEGAYAHLHGTKPQTLAYALSDSQVGLAAWILEKFRAWSDCDGDVEQVFTLDQLLTDISLYWLSDTMDASLRIYKANRLEPLRFAFGEHVEPPLAVASFPRELPMPPRSWVERCHNVVRWTRMPRGGHFAAMELHTLLLN
jgi:hypothetical protein